MIRLALLRHGPTEWNRQGRIQGSSDIPLDADARAGLAGLRLPTPWDRAAVWSSPLRRARETAACLTGSEPRIAPELSEMNWGAWEGLRGGDLAASPASGFRHIEDWGWDFCPPGGESPRMVAARLAPWLAGLEQDALAICHIGVMRVLLAQAHGWAFEGPAPFRIKRNRLFLLTQVRGRLSAAPEPLRLEPR